MAATNVVLGIRLIQNRPEPVVSKELEGMTFDERLEYAVKNAPIAS